jgi:hypothetical protein
MVINIDDNPYTGMKLSELLGMKLVTDYVGKFGEITLAQIIEIARWEHPSILTVLVVERNPIFTLEINPLRVLVVLDSYENSIIDQCILG